MSRQPLEIADIFRAQGTTWRQAHHGHISLDQLKVMSAIETCSNAELAGHVFLCSHCDYQQIACNSYPLVLIYIDRAIPCGQASDNP